MGKQAKLKQERKKQLNNKTPEKSGPTTYPFILVLLVLAIFIILQLSTSQRETVSSASIIQQTPQRSRVEIYNEWLKAANYVAEMSGDQEAIKIAKWLKTNLTVAEPIDDDALFNLPAKDKGKTAVVVVVPDDLKMKVWNEVMNSRQEMIFYSPTAKVLIINSARLEASRFGKGVLLLHEGKHIFDATMDPEFAESAMRKDIRLYAKGEIAAYGLSGRVTAGYWGKPYQRELDQQVLDYRKEMEKPGANLENTRPILDTKAIVEATDVPLTIEEAEYRYGQFGFDLYFSYLDRYEKDRAEELKIQAIIKEYGALAQIERLN